MILKKQSLLVVVPQMRMKNGCKMTTTGQMRMTYHHRILETIIMTHKMKFHMKRWKSNYLENTDPWVKNEIMQTEVKVTNLLKKVKFIAPFVLGNTVRISVSTKCTINQVN